MFGNKGYAGKLVAALAVIAGMGLLAANRGENLNPSVWRCLAEPARFDGAEIWVPAARILEIRDRDYDIDSGSLRIRVAGPAPFPAGSRISLVAVFRRAGPVLEPVRVRPLPAGDLPRRVMEGISILVLVAVLGNFARHFLFRPSALGLARGPD